MKITIVGAGGVGGYFGGRLAQAGNDVTFIARGAHLQALLANGLTVKSIKGGFCVRPVKAMQDISGSGIPDLVIAAVKAWQLKDIAQQLLPVIGEHTMVLPLQNGVTANDELKEVLPGDCVLSGLCRIISMIETPGVVNHIGVDPAIVFGEGDNHKSERVLTLCQVFKNAGINAIVADDIQVALWEKFLGICVSGLLAITRSTYGELREIGETRGMMYNIFTEIYTLAHKLGINISDNYVDKTMASIDTFPYDSTSSLTRDVWEGRPSEIHYQNGTVVRLAEQAGMDVPANRFVYYSILPMEKRARKVNN